MVDVVDVGLGVDKLDQVSDDCYDILLGEHFYIHRCSQPEFAVYAVAAHIAEVISLFGEEKVSDGLAGAGVVRRLGVTQNSVYILDSLLLGVGGIFLECIENDGVVAGVGFLLVQKDCLHAFGQQLLVEFFGKFGFAVDYHLGALDCHNLAGVLVVEVLDPCLHHTCRKFAAYGFLEVGLVYLYLFGQSEDLDDVLIALQADGTQESSDRQFLFTVDVGIHHVVDVRGELNPGAAERYDACRVKLGAV